MNNEPTNLPAERAQYLVFQLGGEEYGVPVMRVKEIIEYDVLTKLPGTSDSVRGVVNLRGHVVPVVDLLIRFNSGQTQVSPLTCIVVVEFEADGETALVGLLTDAVSQVLELGPADIEAAPAFGVGLRTEYLSAIGKLPQKKFLMILDIDKVITAQDAQAYAPPTRPGAEAAPAKPLNTKE